MCRAPIATVLVATAGGKSYTHVYSFGMLTTAQATVIYYMSEGHIKDPISVKTPQN